jgi:CRP-like cAMP-binding protein
MLDVPDRAIWLQERTALSELPLEVLQAIAQVTEEQTILANRRLILEEQAPEHLYILKQGQVESYRTSPNGPAWASSLLPGSIIHLQELLLDQPAQRTVVTLTDCEFWLIPKPAFQQLAAQYPDLAQLITRQLATELAAVSSQLAYEQERQTALCP